MWARKRRIDNTQKEIVAMFRELGASVQHLHDVGKDCPDLLIGYKGVTHLVEVKTPGGKLSVGQSEFINTWQGRTPSVCFSIDDVKKILDSFDKV